MSYSKGEKVITQGVLDGVRFHIIERGTVSIFLGDAKLKSLSIGEYFGELCLLESHAPTATVVAESDVITITLDRAGFKRMLGDETVQNMIVANLKKYVFDPNSKDTPSSLLAKSSQPKDASSAAGLAKQMGGLAVRSMLRLCFECAGDSWFQRVARKHVSPSSACVWLPAAAAEAVPDAAPPVPSPQVGGSEPKGGKSMKIAGLARKNLTMLKELGVGMTGAVYLCKVITPDKPPMMAVAKMMNKMKMLRMNQVCLWRHCWFFIAARGCARQARPLPA